MKTKALISKLDDRTGHAVAIAAGPGVGETRRSLARLEGRAGGSAVRPLQLPRHIDGQPLDEPADVVHIVEIRTWVILTMINVEGRLKNCFTF